MDFNEYQEKALVTKVYPHDQSVVYPIVGLANEAGEALGKIKKVLRRDHSIEKVRDSLINELGDCLWYIAISAHDLGIPLNDVAQRNVDKLADRKERGVIRGDGDDR